MKKALLLLILTMPAKAEVKTYISVSGFSNHNTSQIEVAPGIVVEPSLNEVNLGFGLGARWEGEAGEVWGEFGTYDNSFNRASNYLIGGARVRLGKFMVGPTIGGADGYDNIRVYRLDGPPDGEVLDRGNIQELFGLSIRSGNLIFLYHRNVNWLRITCDFDSYKLELQC